MLSLIAIVCDGISAFGVTTIGSSNERALGFWSFVSSLLLECRILRCLDGFDCRMLGGKVGPPERELCITRMDPP